MLKKHKDKANHDPVPALNLESLDSRLKAAVREVIDQLGLKEAPGGYVVEREANDGLKLMVLIEGRSVRITAPDTAGFLRGVSYISQVIRTEEIIEETRQFDENGLMLDCSRNAVSTVETVKQFIRHLAVMGMNQLMLYTEDTYEVEDYPYFGYLRGAYSEEELQEIDAYGYLLGVEVVPCIQTLAHLQTTLRWPHGSGIKDNEDILLAGEPRTYEFIHAMIEAASAPFRSKKIHLGMDEAHGLGLGEYLNRFGYKDRFEIMNGHLKQVRDITAEFGLEPMIWSDMYFRLAYGGHYYGGAGEIPEEAKNSIPQDMGLVYWDYYHADEASYRQMLDKHSEMTEHVIFAGGVWTWNGIKVNHGRMFATTEAALAVCRERGIRRVFTTAWGDNGQETFLMEALLGLQTYGEYGWRTDVPSRTEIMERLEDCTGTNAEVLYAMRLFDEVPRVDKDNLSSQVVSKQVLYNDPLIGVMDRHISMGGGELAQHYRYLARYFDEASGDRSDPMRPHVLQSAQLADVLARKVDLTLTMRQAYLLDDSEALQKIVNTDIPELLDALDDYKAFTLALWYLYNKPFGSEVLDLRLGGQRTRLATARDRISGYLLGNYDSIPELEAERLSIDGRDDASLAQNPYTPGNRWSYIASVNPL